MNYNQKVSRANPALIAFVIDDSGSMSDPLPGTTDAKYKWTERYYGIIMKELLARCAEARGDSVVIKPRYFIDLIVYGGSPQARYGDIVDVQAAVERYTQSGNSLGLGGSLGGTNAAAAFSALYPRLQKTVAEERFKGSFPPIVFHLTDGESQSDAQQEAERIKQLVTSDGNVLIVNAYIGTQTTLNYAGPEDFIGYHDVAEVGASQDNIRLFHMSSVIPDCMHENLVNDGIFPSLRPGCRLFFDVRTKDMLKHVIQLVSSIGSRANR